MTGRKLSIFISHPSHFLTDSWPHGDGLIANSLLRRLADRGHVLHVAVPLSALENPMPDNVRLYPLETRIPPTNDHPGLAYRVEYAVRVRRLFLQVCRKTRIDLIHQLNPVVGGLSMLLYGLGYPLLLGPIWPLLTNSGARPTRSGSFKAKMKDRLLTPLFLRADGILSPTPASAARLPGAMRQSDRSFTFPLGIDLNRFHPDASVAPNEPTVLFLANVEERKGVFVLLSAFERVIERFPCAKLILAGGGGQLNEVRRRVQQSPYRNRIHLPGHISREDVPRTLRACSVYCLPSFGEPYGMSALEAMACGKPLVVTNTGGLGHLVPDQGSLKVAPGDVPALADALLRLLKDDLLQAEMGRFNREQSETHHSWDGVIGELENIYFELLLRASRENLHLVGSRKEELAL